MKVGTFFLFETLGRTSVSDFYRRALDETVLAEELGFYATCPAEHHFSEHYGIMPRVELFLAWVASRTRSIRLWPMVIVAPLRNPVQLAEDTAILDQFSQGRMVLSIGSGYRPYEFTPFGQDIRENSDRLREIAEVTVRLWTEGEVRHEGKHYRVDGATLQPRPFQRPHPPVYVTTTRDDQIRWAAERGFGVVPAAGFNPSTLRHDYDLYARYARAAGKPDMEVKPFFKWVYVDDDHKRGVEDGTRFILQTLMAFAQGGGRLFSLLMGKSLDTWGTESERPEWLGDRMEKLMEAGVTYDEMVRSNWLPYVCGDPAHVADVLRGCAEAGGNFFIGGFDSGAMPPEKVARSMRLFAEKVLPRL